MNIVDGLLQVNQEVPAKDDLQEGVDEQQNSSDRVNVEQTVTTKPNLPPIPTIRFGACSI